MKFTVTHNNQQYAGDFQHPIDISIPTFASENSAVAWYVSPTRIEPVRTERFTGSVAEGGTVNFRDIAFNPHGNTTHVECVGHISEEVYSINQSLQQFTHIAKLVTLSPKKYTGITTEYLTNEDLVIDQMDFEELGIEGFSALILRTLPNNPEKITRRWDNTNWPFLTPNAAIYLRERGIKHLLIDLPSVDKELDGGLMLAHKAFWHYPESTRYDATITEMIYVKPEVLDGLYLLNLQMASFENDASPCKPILYKILPY